MLLAKSHDFGEQRDMKVGRNDPCPCGSGKKYKKCCLAKDEALRAASPPAAQTLEAETEADNESWEETETSGTFELETLPSEVEKEEEPALEEWEEPEDLEEETAESGGFKYPRPGRKLPKLPPDQEKLVEAWWGKTSPAYESMDIDVLLKQVEVALTELPDRFVHLGLHEEFFFELGAAMARSGRTPEYISLLKRLRHEQRRMYSFVYGAFDSDVIGELVVSNQSNDIPAYLDLFKEYPDAQPDYCAEICDLLAWRGQAQPLFLLCEAVAAPMLLSPEVINGGFALDWLIRRAEIPFLEAGDASPEAVSKVVEEVKQLGERIGYPMEPEAESFKADLEAGLNGPRLKANRFPDARAQNALLIHFASSLHRNRNIPWVQGLFLGELLWEYIWWCRREERPWLRLTKKDIEAYAVYASKRFFCCKGVRLLGALQTLVWFGEYAQAAQILPTTVYERLTGDCRQLFETGRNAVESTDPAYRIFPQFDQLIGP
ncbi:MAG TPA: SEC-C metal-binding domain-containing protein [Clostridia bacterium]|nr:SEC-C metal-binding domain-containing protein [Clostridia bacterium]